MFRIEVFGDGHRNSECSQPRSTHEYEPGRDGIDTAIEIGQSLPHDVISRQCRIHGLERWHVMKIAWPARANATDGMTYSFSPNVFGSMVAIPFVIQGR